MNKKLEKINPENLQPSIISLQVTKIEGSLSDLKERPQRSRISVTGATMHILAQKSSTNCTSQVYIASHRSLQLTSRNAEQAQDKHPHILNKAVLCQDHSWVPKRRTIHNEYSSFLKEINSILEQQCLLL